MAKKRFTWLAALIAQVDTFTPGGTIEADDIFILTYTKLDGSTYSVSYTGSSTVSVITAGLKAAWDANSVTAAIATSTDNGTNLALTAVTAGVGFKVDQTTTEANGDAADAQTFARAATTDNSGPKDINAAGNYTDGALPEAADDVIFEGDSTNNEILYSLDKVAWGTLASLRTDNAQIGTDPAAGVLPIYATIDSTIMDVNKHEGPGTVAQTKSVYIDAGTVSTTFTLHDGAANQSDPTMPAVWFKATHATTVVKCLKGKLGVAYRDGETSTILSAETGYVKNITNDAELILGNGVTVTTITQKGGKISQYCPAATVNADLGNYLLNGDSAISSAINVDKGVCDIRSTGTIASIVVDGTGSIDTTKTKNAVTITNLKLNSGTATYGTKDTITNRITPDNDIKLVATAA